MNGRVAVMHKVGAGKRIVGSVMYRPSVVATLLDFLVRRQRHLPFHTLVSHGFPLDDINDVFERAEWDRRQTEVTRAVLVP